MRWLVDGQAFHEQRLDVMWNTSSGGGLVRVGSGAGG